VEGYFAKRWGSGAFLPDIRLRRSAAESFHFRCHCCRKKVKESVPGISQGSEPLNVGWLRLVYWKYFSKPAQDRLIYRLIDRGHVMSITEIGVGNGQRALRMIALALRHHPPEKVRYAGLDLFEAHPESSRGLSLKEAFRLLNPTGVQIRLVPGDLLSGLLRSANTLTHTDLVVIGAEMDPAAMEPAWFYFPRMLHKSSTVLLELGNVRPDFQPLNQSQVVELAKKAASAVRRVG
jgi:hypothetical protein